jgi:hypothetical protein
MGTTKACMHRTSAWCHLRIARSHNNMLFFMKDCTIAPEFDPTTCVVISPSFLSLPQRYQVHPALERKKNSVNSVLYIRLYNFGDFKRTTTVQRLNSLWQFNVHDILLNMYDFPMSMQEFLLSYGDIKDLIWHDVIRMG